MLFAADGACLGVEQRELAQHYPRPGWVEHDAEEIWQSSPRLRAGDGREGGRRGADRRRSASPTSARRSASGRGGPGEPLARAIVWQDRRTADLCAALKARGTSRRCRRRPGCCSIPISRRSKIAWAMANWPALREAGDDLCVGTVESWLVFKLTGGLHVSDATNASRTALMDIHKGGWDDGAARPVRRAARRAARDRRLRRALRRDRPTCSARRSRSAAWPATSRRRRSARPASRRARPRRPTAPAPSC